MSQRTRIQIGLAELVRNGRFIAVTYDPTTGLPNPIDLENGENIPATKVLANETTSTFDTDNLQGRRLARRKIVWTFQLRIEFPVEVTLEAFETFITDPVPCLPREDDLPQVLLYLVEAQAEHPPQQSPSHGTRVVYTFEAVEGRR